jgi:hypothetical protein
MDVSVSNGVIRSWKLSEDTEEGSLVSSNELDSSGAMKMVTQRNFEFGLPLAWLSASPNSADKALADSPVANRIRLRFSMWQNKLPIDALPLEGWIDLQVISENEMAASGF